ncbi:coiled-coil domain-containing protein 111 [Musa troglodytarum]|uniref:DNA-directed primase/polymerase protein n=1 Tax=Musa troglodytarum TaxID=320322 RepID=A0A9E7G541_9LILI|nr:coiled-coil domain-containing protein 111 [Musa troglodytarum]
MLSCGRPFEHRASAIVNRSREVVQRFLRMVESFEWERTGGGRGRRGWAEASLTAYKNLSYKRCHLSFQLGACTSVAIKLKSGKQISPIVFYGSPHGAPIKRPSRLLRLLHEIRIDLKEDNDLILREELWTTFPRQEEAISFLKAHAQFKLFSYQDHLNGQRRFLVSTYSEFWRRYRCMDPKLRHHYEVIKEVIINLTVFDEKNKTDMHDTNILFCSSSDTWSHRISSRSAEKKMGLPCHLYFDLEFDKTVNADKNVDDMVDILMSVTFNILFEKYAIKANDGWIIELDSSTTKKFSRHVIIRMPKIAFKDNLHVGAFVSEVCSHITSQRGSDPQLDKLYARKDSSSSDFQLFLDSAVYSRNRCFRLVFSSKAGKNSFLLPTGRFKCKDMTEQEVFMESLICRMDSDCNKLLKCQIDTDCKKTLYFDFEVQQQTSDALQHTALNAYRSDFPSTYSSGKSPFPALDAFVEFIASSGNVLVMYIADLQRAIYYQKCYDPDCRGYRSPLRPLPHDVIPSDILLFDSTQRINYREDLDTNFGLEPDGSHMEHCSCDGDELVTDSCNMENSWWQEAMTYADHIENMKNAPEFKILNEENAGDCSWWMDVEKLASLVEGQLG